jgi:hypothetical protein
MIRKAIDPDRRARVQAISDAATVRMALGQEAHYQRSADGLHLVSLFDRAAGRLRTSSGPTVAAAIAGMKQEEQVR